MSTHNICFHGLRKILHDYPAYVELCIYNKYQAIHKAYMEMHLHIPKL